MPSSQSESVQLANIPIVCYTAVIEAAERKNHCGMQLTGRSETTVNRGRKADAIFIFIGMLLIAFFVVGLTAERNPQAFTSRYRYDYALESFIRFCKSIWLPAGIIGFPVFLISLIISLWHESKENRK